MHGCVKKQGRWYGRRSAVISGVAAAILAISGGALAYWTTSGTGTGTATSSAGLSSVTVTQVGSVSGLAPGDTAQAVDFKITNSAGSPQHVTSVSVAISSVVKTSDGSAAVGCTAADFDLVQPTVSFGDMAPGDTSFSPSGATIAMKNTGSNQNGCKSVTVNLAFTAA
jgi:hypothetical protein